MRIETSRLILRRPVREDAEAIFESYACDPDVTRYLTWPTHKSIDDTLRFLDGSEAEWERWPAGPLLIESRSDGSLLGGTGYAFSSPAKAVTGYVFAKDAWGQGYATEALNAVVKAAPELGVRQLEAFVHPANGASVHVLEKCGFIRHRGQFHSSFPNLNPDTPEPCFLYLWVRPSAPPAPR